MNALGFDKGAGLAACLIGMAAVSIPQLMLEKEE